MKKVILISFIVLSVSLVFVGCTQPFNPVDQALINSLNEYDDGYLQRNWDAMKNVFDYPVEVESTLTTFDETELETEYQTIFAKYNGFWLGVNYNSNDITVTGDKAVAKIVFSVWKNEDKSDLKTKNIDLYFEKNGSVWKIYKMSRFEIDD
ncbi:MAG: hypothetical protein PWQ77_1184 [Kosmotogales bacterium]|nr:hypothetical protein [Kosmotogales bacterium]